jgi:hypothetical protein
MEFSDLIKRTITQTLMQLRVSMPCIVTAYNPVRQMVSVRIAQPEVTLSGEVVQMPIIVDVPVSFTRCGNAHITFPINAGDTGFLIFADRDVSNWLNSGNGGVPDSQRTHSINDAYFVAGIVGGGVSANPNDVEIKYNGTSIHIRKNGDVDITAPTVKISGDLEVGGGITTGDNVTVNGIAYAQDFIVI